LFFGELVLPQVAEGARGVVFGILILCRTAFAEDITGA
jgi:hypothetical protein